MERVQAEESRAVADGGAVARMAPLARWLAGYLFVAAPVMAACAGVLDGPWASGFSYAVLLLGVGSICRAVLPPRPMERVRAVEDRAAVNADADSHENVASPDNVIVWCGYVLVAAPMMGLCAGLLDDPWPAGFAYAALLLGVASICRAVLPLPPRPMERMLEREIRPVANGNRRGEEAVVRGAGTITMDWTGYFVVAAPVVASWAGLVEGPAATFFAFALLLLGIAFVIMAMLAVAKPKMA